MDAPDYGADQAVAQPQPWLVEQAESPDALEATLADGSVRLLLLPGHVSAHAALEVLIGERDGDDLPWQPGEWLETQDACWIRREGVVALRILPRGAPPVDVA